jgi:hypothetical protein
VVQVENGKVIADTYELNPAYQLFTAQNGFFMLFPSLHEKLLQELARTK